MYESVDDEVLERFSVDSLEGTCAESPPKPSTLADNSPIRSCVPFRLHDESDSDRGRHLLGFAPPPDECKLSWNCEIDESVLMSKGLQLNEDGSFSKSPREGGRDDLPFIMPAPRVALIRRKKKDTKKNPEATTGELSRLKASGNLTDSMKEALYKKYSRKDENSGVDGLLAKFKKDLCVEEKTPKKNKSDLHLPVIEKPTSLSYFERYQQKNGFDPRSITHKGHKPVKDTVRSKFGDSSRDTLSEVSSRFTTADEDDDEELFYQKIISEDGFKVGNSVSDYSDRSFGESRADKAVERKKEVKIMKRKSKASPSGSTLRTLGSISSGRKSSHHCATEEPLPKAELISKARAYGNLANTRNIVKMQLKSYRRDWECPGNEALQGSNKFLPPLKERRGIL